MRSDRSTRNTRITRPTRPARRAGDPSVSCAASRTSYSDVPHSLAPPLPELSSHRAPPACVGRRDRRVLRLVGGRGRRVLAGGRGRAPAKRLRGGLPTSSPGDLLVAVLVMRRPKVDRIATSEVRRAAIVRRRAGEGCRLARCNVGCGCCARVRAASGTSTLCRRWRGRCGIGATTCGGRSRPMAVTPSERWGSSGLAAGLTTAARREAAGAVLGGIMQLPMAQRRGPLFAALFARAAGPVMQRDLATDHRSGPP